MVRIAGSSVATTFRDRLIDRFLPTPEAAKAHVIRVRAPADFVFDVAEEFDLLSIPAVRAIFRLRAGLLRARPPGGDDTAGLVRRTQEMGWVELARRPGREIVMGAATRPWLPEPVFLSIPPERFRTWNVPGFVKIVWTLEAEPAGPALTRFTTETRVQPTDEIARRKFRRYWLGMGLGIGAIRRLALPAIRERAERRFREIGEWRAAPGARRAPLLEAVLPRFDATLVRQIVVTAPPDVTFAAIGQADLLDPAVRSLFAIRELPARLATRLRGGAHPRRPLAITLEDLLRPGSGVSLVAEKPGREVVVGSVGRFWGRDSGPRDVPGEAFARFREPGYSKLAMDLRVTALDDTRSLLRYEARTATTDEVARRRFRRYWPLVRPGVGLVMARSLVRIRRRAEEEWRRREDDIG